MQKRIKTKQMMYTIKTKDKKRHLKTYIKHQQIMSRDKMIDNIEDESSASNKAEVIAVNQISNTSKVAINETFDRSMEIANNQYHKVRPYRFKSNKNKLSINNSMNKASNQKQNPTYTSSFLRHRYKKSMKKNYLNQQKKKKFNFYSNNIFRTIYHEMKDIAKMTYTIFKTAFISISSLISLGTGILLLLVITLFIGVFGSLSDNSLYGIAVSQLTEEVLAYTDVINEYAEQYDILEFTPLVQAIMMHESKGIGNDPMNASSFEYNLMYPDGIEDPIYSIQVGVQYLIDCLNQADVKSPADTKKVHLAIQAYNYGLEYIEWANDNFGGYSKANAQVYLDMKKEQNNNTFIGSASYVPNVWIYYRGSHARIVEIAKSQIGNIGGEKYWRWYGFESRVEWCAIFVSWCAQQSGDLNITVPRFAGVDSGMAWYKEKNSWQNSDYIPSPGDIVFFDWNLDNDPDHVGIVEKVEDNKLYTIEGNSNDTCRSKVYNCKSQLIIGFGI